MRVAYVSMDAGVPVFGNKGCSIHVQEMVRAFMKLGARVDLFAASLGGNPPADLFSVQLHRFPESKQKEPRERELLALRANDELERMLESAGPFDFIYERYSLWSYAAMEFARRQGIPGVLEVNAPLIDEQAKHRSLMNVSLGEAVAELVFGMASSLVAVSAEVAEYLERFVTARGRIHIVPNGVNVERFASPVLSELSSPGAFTIGFVGTLKPWHGLPALIDAFTLLHRRRPETRLLIVGDGPERNAIESRLRERGVLDATCLIGAVSPAEVPAYLRSMSVAVAPYPETPGFYFSPLKVYEYMAAGLPVVASRIGQLAEVITDGETGLLCSAGDAVSFAAAFEVLMDDPKLRRQLGEAARAHVRDKHTWDQVAQRILRLAGMEAEVLS